MGNGRSLRDGLSSPTEPVCAVSALRASIPSADVVHFISADRRTSAGNVTACGKKFVYPMRGNGWRVRDITCPDCDRVICDLAHASGIAAQSDETLQAAQPEARARPDAQNQGDQQ